MNKKMALMMVLIFGLGVIFVSCAGEVEPTMANFKNPAIKIELIDVPQYDGYWYYDAKVKPSAGKAGNHGAPLPVAITFNITNPNPYPILLDGYHFTMAFEGFDLITIAGYDTQWIPAGKTEGFFTPKVVAPYTNQLRATTTLMPRAALLSLLVTGGYKLKAKGMNAMGAIEGWWTKITDLAFPITIHDGAFTFKANGVTKVVGFKATYTK